MWRVSTWPVKSKHLIEAKFSAPLTHHQPNTYWQRLPSDRPTALVFLAPADRLDHLLGDLTERLKAVGFRMGDQQRRN